MESGATLGGTGSVGGLVANSGATVAPGVLGPYATFTVTGEASFAAGSTFAVNINPAGQNDKLVTTGTTTLSGGTVAVNGAGGTYLPSTRYTLLTAQGGVSGTFSSLSTSGDLATLAFLDPELSYDADDVYLGFAVKPFVSAAQTPNQAATALALQAQPVGSPLYNALISQTASGALSAFNALSGEVHASAVGAAFDDTRLPREAVLDRLAESYGAPSPSSAKTVQTYGFSTPTQVYSAWAQGFNSWGHLGGNGNSATVGNNIGGFILGADATLYGRYRLGVAGGYANSNISDPARGSTGNISAAYIGLYGGASFDALQLRGGAFYANNHYGLDRMVSFPGFYQTAGSGYGGDTAEVFGEAGWRIAVAAPFVSAASVEPFLGVAGVDLHTASFTETPGPASLVGGSENAGYGIYDAWAAQRGDDVRRRAHDAERHDRLAACLRRADAERDVCFRERPLDPVLDRRGADRARRARPRIRPRPAPHLERQAQRLLFRTSVVERQRQRHQGQARGDFLTGQDPRCRCPPHMDKRHWTGRDQCP